MSKGIFIRLMDILIVFNLFLLYTYYITKAMQHCGLRPDSHVV